MISGFFDNKEVVSEDFARFAAGILSNGVLADTDGVLKVSAVGGMSVDVAPGYCWINGCFGKAETSENLDITLASGTYARIDRIVARLEYAARSIYLDVITGTESASPTAPAITRDSNVYELGLATVHIPAGALEVTADMITDTRMDDAVCGGVIARTGDKLSLDGKADQSYVDKLAAAYAAAGDIKLTARTTAPTGWLICDGAAVSRTTYAALFSAIGTTYGAGNGSTTFNLPNLKGRTAVGYNSAETEFNTVGKTGGEKAHSLTVAELPAHTHAIPYGANVAGSTEYFESFDEGWSPAVNQSDDKATKATGGGSAHNILQPYMALNYIIYTGVL